MSTNQVSYYIYLFILLYFTNCKNDKTVNQVENKQEISPKVKQNSIIHDCNEHYYLKKLKDAKPNKNGLVKLFLNDEKHILVHPDSVYCLDLFGDWENTIFPKEVFNFKNIRYLYLGMRSFKKIPSEISTLSKLERIDFQHSALETLPKEITQLKNLKEIILHYCTNFKKLPDEICELKSLNFLQIAFTRIDTSLMQDCIRDRRNGVFWVFKDEIDGEKYFK
jgi:Leucine-rich repeat (LRR) protein